MRILPRTESNRAVRCPCGLARAVFGVLLWVTVAGISIAEEVHYESGGHLKSRINFQGYPSDSLFRQLAGSNAWDFTSEARGLFTAQRGPFDFKADGQAIWLYGDLVELAGNLDGSTVVPGILLAGRMPQDDRRWWDLTEVYDDKRNRALVGRLDRLSVGYTGDALSLRFGRQAISWGNGLIYSPMDIVNPFDPTQVDTEYKAGDDMFYGQYLRSNGEDIEGGYVVRRDPATGKVDSEEATAAAKYHGYIGNAEYDLLLAEHFDDPLVALGGSRDVGGAVWRGDLVLTDTDTDDVVTQAVVNSSYSWYWGGKNMTGSAEYYYNGFGQDDGCYTSTCLADNPELVQKIAQGQLFTLGRHYLGGSLTVEMTPLFTLTPNVFWNLSDGSALLQLVTNYSLGDNLVVLGSAGIPMGPDGTEFGGLPTDAPGVFLSSSYSLFAQLAWYF